VCGGQSTPHNTNKIKFKGIQQAQRKQSDKNPHKRILSLEHGIRRRYKKENKLMPLCPIIPH